MRHPIFALLSICGVLSTNSACRGQTPSDERRSAPHQSIRSTNCTAEQHAELKQALEGICWAVAQPDGRCQTVLTQFGVRKSFQRQCERGLTVRCAEAGCGQYFRKNLLYRSDDGTIEMGLGSLSGGRGCGGYDSPTLGPVHTMTHETAHAAGVLADGYAEQIA